MRIHVQSDLHLEQSVIQESAIASDVAVCAGDIGSLVTTKEKDKLRKYFEDRKMLAEHVIWVLGNHEFYHMQYEDCLAEAEKLAKECGVILMDEVLGTENQVIDGVTFWGATLWSDLGAGDWFIRDSVSRNINDFYVIKNGQRNFSTSLMTDINRRTRDKINWDADVVITHFSPIMIKHPRFPLNQITYYFNNTGMDDRIMDSNIKFWIYGHTHHSHVEDLNGTLVVSNQHGYAGEGWEPEACGFDPNFIIEV